MIRRELAAYHNYTPRMVLFRGVVFLILDFNGFQVAYLFPYFMRLDDVLMKIYTVHNTFLNVFRELASLMQ